MSLKSLLYRLREVDYWITEVLDAKTLDTCLMQDVESKSSVDVSRQCENLGDIEIMGECRRRINQMRASVRFQLPADVDPGRPRPHA